DELLLAAPPLLAPAGARAPEAPVRPAALHRVPALEAHILALRPFAIFEHQAEAEGEDDDAAGPGQRADDRRQHDQQHAEQEQQPPHQRYPSPGQPFLPYAHRRLCGVARRAWQYRARAPGRPGVLAGPAIAGATTGAGPAPGRYGDLPRSRLASTFSVGNLGFRAVIAGRGEDGRDGFDGSLSRARRPRGRGPGADR